MSQTPASTAPKFGIGTKLLYGAGSVAFGVTTLSLTSAVLQPYLNRVIGLPAFWVGTAIMLTLMVDAVFDTALGHFSDRLRTKWGRRHPLMYLAAPLVALACIAFWNSPASWSPEKAGIYLIAMLILMRFSVALYEIPSAALGPELTSDYLQRTSLFSYRFFFGVIGGTVMNVILYQVYLNPQHGGILNRQGYADFSVLAAGVMAASILVSAIGTHRHIPHLNKPAIRNVPLSQVMAEIRGTILNPSLMVVMASGFCSGVAIGMGTALSQYFYVELWGLTAKFVSYISIAGVLASLSGVALAGPAARLMGKKHAMITLFTMSIIADALPQAGRLLGFMPPNSSPWVLRILVADGLFAGTLAIAGYIIISSMIADVVEDAAVKTGVRSEGLLMAANGLLPKFTNGFGVFLAGVVITVAQFPVHAPPGSVSPDIMRHMSLLFLPFSTFMKGLSVFVLFFYRIDEAKHRENLETLAQAAAMAEIADIEDARPSSVAAGSTVV